VFCLVSCGHRIDFGLVIKVILVIKIKQAYAITETAALDGTYTPSVFKCCLSVHVDNYTIIVPTKSTNFY
jgi:hypothetical protein